jgi:hypothetical protein
MVVSGTLATSPIASMVVTAGHAAYGARAARPAGRPPTHGSVQNPVPGHQPTI